MEMTKETKGIFRPMFEVINNNSFVSNHSFECFDIGLLHYKIRNCFDQIAKTNYSIRY